MDRRRSRPARRPFGIGTAVVCFVLAAATAAHAGERHEWRLAIGPVAGGVALDPSLNDYRWDTQPALQSGLQTTLFRGRGGAGVRFLRSHTTQSSGIPGASQAPRVNLMAYDVVGKIRVVSVASFELWGSGHTGILHLGYDPDQQTFDVNGTPVTVDYEPISEWNAGIGAEIRRELLTHMALSLQVDTSTFALDTAHRQGSEIVFSRERFYNWSLRLQVSWLLSLG
jgi:hypothetical protein